MGTITHKTELGRKAFLGNFINNLFKGENRQNYDIGRMMFIITLIGAAFWMVSYYIQYSGLPPFTTSFSLLMFILIPYAVIRFLTGGTILHLIIGIAILFAFVYYGQALTPEIFQAIFTGFDVSGVRLSMLSLMSSLGL